LKATFFILPEKDGKDKKRDDTILGEETFEGEGEIPEGKLFQRPYFERCNITKNSKANSK
jgi:hypothetical protein